MLRTSRSTTTRRPAMDEGIKFFVGLDVHKDTIAVAVAEADRAVRGRRTARPGLTVPKSTLSASRPCLTAVFICSLIFGTWLRTLRGAHRTRRPGAFPWPGTMLPLPQTWLNCFTPGFANSIRGPTLASLPRTPVHAFHRHSCPQALQAGPERLVAADDPRRRQLRRRCGRDRGHRRSLGVRQNHAARASCRARSADLG